MLLSWIRSVQDLSWHENCGPSIFLPRKFCNRKKLPRFHLLCGQIREGIRGGPFLQLSQTHQNLFLVLLDLFNILKLMWRPYKIFDGIALMPSTAHRCLEGGAEEFFLKPVQLADLKRLRPHILKGKSKENTTVIGTGTSTSSSSGSNKRKAIAIAIDEDLAPNKRTRLRFSSSSSSLTLVWWEEA